MNPVQSSSDPYCFFSMPFNHRYPEWLYKTVKEIGGRKGLDVKLGNTQSLASNLRRQLQEQIDGSFMVLAEASGFSWYVAFEVFYALEHKICSVLVLENDLPGVNLDRSVVGVFPEKIFCKYQRPLPRDPSLENLEARIDELFGRALTEGEKWSRFITAMTHEVIRPPKTQVELDPPIKVNGRQKPRAFKIDSGLFSDWCIVKPQPRRIAVVAPSGAGKTFLLSRFARLLKRPRSSPPNHFNQLSPVVVFMNTGSLPERLPDEFSTEDLWKIIQQRVDRWEDEASNEKNPRRNRFEAREFTRPGLLEPYRRAGLLYVVFDGLDELGSRREVNLKRFLDALDGLSERCVNIIVSCRKVFWIQKARPMMLNQEYQVVEILPFEDEAVKELFNGHGIPLASRAFKRPWVRSPIAIGFILDLWKNERRRAALNVGSILSKPSNLYAAWATHTAAKEEKRCKLPRGAMYKLLSDFALHLLKNRKYSTEIPPTALPGNKSGQLLDLGKLEAGELLVPDDIGKEYKFYHESVYEFFATTRLVEGFREVVREPFDYANASIQALAEAELDYLQSSAYGFLNEMLSPQYDRDVYRFLKTHLDEGKLSETSVAPKLLRNLIEYVGLTYRGGYDRELAELLLRVIQSSDLSVLVRFNAARALERIHPCAPRPYFDYISDWGEFDWTDAIASADHLYSKRKIHGYVIRGHRREKPSPSTHRYFAPNTSNNLQRGFQAEISRQLCDVLAALMKDQNLFVDPAYGDSPITINCSWALGRWFYKRKDEKLRRMMAATATRKGLHKTAHNLKHWVAGLADD